MHDAARLLQDVNEQQARGGILAKGRIDQRSRAPQRAQGAGRHAAQLLVLHHEQKGFQDRGGLAPEGVLALDVQQLAAHLEPLVQRARRRVGPGRKPRLEVLQQDGVELRHALRGLVVALHHRFARAPGRTVGVAELGGERALQVEDDAVFPPPGEVVQPDAQVLEVRLVAREAARFAGFDHAARNQVGPAWPDSRRPGDPLDHLQVAQPAGRFLQVGLERVRRILVLGVPLLLLELLRAEKCRRIASRRQLLLELAKQRLAAGERARLEQRGRNRDVARGCLDAARHRAHAVADFQADVPHRADQSLERSAASRTSRSMSEHGYSSPRP